MGLVKKVLVTLAAVAAIGVATKLNYDYGLKAYDNLNSGMTKEQSEKEIRDGLKNSYCPDTERICSPGILLDPVTMFGRSISYGLHPFFKEDS